MSGLVVRRLRRHYGGVAAVDGVDLDAPAGAVTALIGPNGAGKTTLFTCLTGLDPADGGSVTLDGRALDRLRPHERARSGLAWTFQRIELFAGLTVAENVRVGAENRRQRSLTRGLLGLPDKDGDADRVTTEAVLERLGLASLARTPAGALPTGTMRLVELGRALAGKPRALLLDEPASGLDDAQVERLAAVLRALAADGIAVLLVEHDMRFVSSVADRVSLMASGRVVLTGTPAEVAADPTAQRLYLGEA